MTLEEVGISTDELMEVRDRSLTENYKPHDLAQDYLESRLEVNGFGVEQHGDDARHADTVMFGDGPDIRVFATTACETLLCYIEVKSKRVSTGQEWFGRLNKRHWNEYVDFAGSAEVPVVLWFALVDEDDEMVVREEFIEVEDTTQVQGDVTEISEVSVTFDGGDVQEVAGTDLQAVASKDISGVRRRDQLVEGIPNVHGNDVVVLDKDDFRSFQWFLHEFGGDTEVGL